jgi:hypothetical protein
MTNKGNGLRMLKSLLTAVVYKKIKGIKYKPIKRYDSDDRKVHVLC